MLTGPEENRKCTNLIEAPHQNFSAQASAAIAAARLIGAELHGMFIERKEKGRPGDFAGLSDAEIEQKLMETLIERGLSEEAARVLVARQRTKRGMLDPRAGREQRPVLIDVTPEKDGEEAV